MNKEIEYKGYTAVAYGHISISVFKNGQEVNAHRQHHIGERHA